MSKPTFRRDLMFFLFPTVLWHDFRVVAPNADGQTVLPMPDQTVELAPMHSRFDRLFVGQAVRVRSSERATSSAIWRWPRNPLELLG